MALKPDRQLLEVDISMTCASAAERGVVLVYSTAGSGIAMGDNAHVADLLTPSGKVPAGLLLNDVVDIDQTRYHLNFHKDEVQKNSRVNLLRKGRVTTNKISGTPAAGDVAYLTTNGELTPTRSTTGGVAATPPVGKFHSKKDADGYCAVDIMLPCNIS